MSKSPRLNKFDYIEFPANSSTDLQHSKVFYQKVFGWAYQDWGADYSDTKSSGVGSGINADPDHRSRHPLAVVYCQELEVMKAAVIEAKGVISRDIFAFPGGRRFHFVDPSGNELAVWSDK